MRLSTTSFIRLSLQESRNEDYKQNILPANHGQPQVHGTQMISVSEPQAMYMFGYCHAFALAMKELFPEMEMLARIGWDPEDCEGEDDFKVDHIFLYDSSGYYDFRGKFSSQEDLLNWSTGYDDEVIHFDKSEIDYQVSKGDLKPYTRHDIDIAIEFINAHSGQFGALF